MKQPRVHTHRIFDYGWGGFLPPYNVFKRVWYSYCIIIDWPGAFFRCNTKLDVYLGVDSNLCKFYCTFKLVRRFFHVFHPKQILANLMSKQWLYLVIQEAGFISSTIGKEVCLATRVPFLGIMLDSAVALVCRDLVRWRNDSAQGGTDDVKFILVIIGVQTVIIAQFWQNKILPHEEHHWTTKINHAYKCWQTRFDLCVTAQRRFVRKSKNNMSSNYFLPSSIIITSMQEKENNSRS